MIKKSIFRRIKDWFYVISYRIKYINTKWCFDESECTNKTKDCKTCPYYLDENK